MPATFYHRNAVLSSIAGRTDVASKKRARAEVILGKIQSDTVPLPGDLTALSTFVTEDSGLTAQEKSSIQAAIKLVARLKAKGEAKQLAAEAVADLTDAQTTYDVVLQEIAADAGSSNAAILNQVATANFLNSELTAVKSDSATTRDAIVTHKVTA